MSKKKLKSSDQVNILKSFFTLADDSFERKLISSNKDAILNNLISTFENQFYYSIQIKKNKAEIFYSPSVTKITGYNPEELIKFNLLGRELIIEDDLPSIKKRIIAFEKSNDDYIEMNYRIRHKDGSIYWLNEKVKIAPEDNKSGNIFAVITDITRQKEKEILFDKHVDDLKNQIRARDNFLSILSHDLRAPFSSILGFTEILLSDAVLSDSEKAEYLNYINDSSNNQLRLVNYLLDWSNLQIGRLHLEKHRVQAQSIVYNCISSLTGNAMRKNMEIKVNVPESIFVEADERLMIQVITNLVSNAIKFSEDGKTIYISAERFNNDLVEFIIKDEGIGIPENYHSRIFKFDKMFSTRGTKGERGTGLGLSLVKEIIERHNGEIWFYSKEKEGSEFHFTVPSSDNTILLVENNKQDYLMLEKLILENYPGFKFIGADNGFEAINIVLKQHPSLIISSHDLPLMNGVQFVKSILRGDKKFYAPIIAVVDSPDDSLIRSYKEIGIKSILYKPVDIRLFDREINLALN